MGVPFIGADIKASADYNAAQSVILSGLGGEPVAVATLR